VNTATALAPDVYSIEAVPFEAMRQGPFNLLS